MSHSVNKLNLSRSRVLAIDDNPRAMEILSQILLGFGITHTKKAFTATEARSLADSEAFDLIIVDDEMPDEDGFDFVRRTRCNPKGPNVTNAIIMVSAFTSRARIETARDSGVNVVISKPIVPGVLLDRIGWIARQQRAFISCESYSGPDRRFQNVRRKPGEEERRSANLAMVAAPERALSQDEINALFD